MRGILQSMLVVVGFVFGGCVGAVLGLATCLILRDAWQWPMPLARIMLITSIFAAVGGLVSVVIDVWRLCASARRSSSNDADVAEENSG